MAEADTRDKVRVAAVGDVHMHAGILGQYHSWLEGLAAEADVLALCGDLTNNGHRQEADLLVTELKACRLPIVAVLGNHDYTEGEEEAIMEILTAGGVHVLHYEPYVLRDVGFVGTKGFGGGFDNHMLSNFGEAGMRAFVQEAIEESLQLEKGLHSLAEVPHRVAVLHYSPVRETAVGEPEEIFPFLGSSRLAEPLDHSGVDLVVHGHAHNGSYKGATAKGAPVYNVAMPLVAKELQKPYAVFEV